MAYVNYGTVFCSIHVFASWKSLTGHSSNEYQLSAPFIVCVTCLVLCFSVLPFELPYPYPVRAQTRTIHQAADICAFPGRYYTTVMSRLVKIANTFKVGRFVFCWQHKLMEAKREIWTGWQEKRRKGWAGSNATSKLYTPKYMAQCVADVSSESKTNFL